MGSVAVLKLLIAVESVASEPIVAGELGIDFEVREATIGRGLGVFALRDFEKNTKIMAERCIMICPV